MSFDGTRAQVQSGVQVAFHALMSAACLYKGFQRNRPRQDDVEYEW